MQTTTPLDRTDTSSGSAVAPILKLAPYETRLIDVAAFQKNQIIPAEAHWAAVELTSSTRPNDLMATAASYDSTLRYGTQTPFNDQLTFHWEGGEWQVDGTHNSIITAGNGGSIPIKTQFTLYYDSGKKRYDMEQELKPHEQMWVDVGKLIREQVPDKNGLVIPSDVTTGAFELKDLTDRGVGNLFEGKVIVDKTFGHVAYGCSSCCGFSDAPYMYYDPIGVPLGFGNGQDVWDMDFCTLERTSVLDYMLSTSWDTGNHAIATASRAVITGVGVGSTTNFAQGTLTIGGIRSRQCPPNQVNPSGNACVGSLVFNGTANDFIFVGTDPNILSANTYFLTLASGTPTGGTYGGSSSDTNDKVTLTWDSELNMEKATIQTTDQSTAVGDRTLTFTYTPPSCGAISLVKKVTARQFAWVTNNSPGNICNLGYGWQYTYFYTPYTHPDGLVVPGEGLLTGTATGEVFNPTTISCGNKPGNSSLDANSQFQDNIELCSTQPLPVCSSTNTQTLSIAGYTVRTNSLTIANTGLTYTSEGPTK